MHTMTIYSVTVLFEDGEHDETIYVRAATAECAEAFVRAMGKGQFGFYTHDVDAYTANAMGREIHNVIYGDRAPEKEYPFGLDDLPVNVAR